MTSTLKIIVLFAVLLGMIFGVTYIMQYTPTVEEVDPAQVPTVDGKVLTPLEVPSGRIEPNEDSAANRSFPGYFEPGTEHTVQFWFRNPNPYPVQLQLGYVSCSACSEGGVAAIPPETLDRLGRLYGVSSLAFGPLPASALLTSLAESEFQHALNALPWQWKKFADDPQARYDVPAATGDEPQWGLIRLKFTARPPQEVRNLHAKFLATLASTPPVTREYAFDINFMVVAPFDVIPPQIDVGELRLGTGPRKYELRVLSSTRNEKTFPPPIADVRDAAHASVGNDALVTVGKPEPLGDVERQRLVESHHRRLHAAYSYPVTITPYTDTGAFDIGPFERNIWFTPLGGLEGEEKKATVRGSIKGSIWLGGDGIIKLGDRPTSRDITEKVKVYTEKPNVELEWEPAQTHPEFLQAKLERDPSETDRGAYWLTVTIPAKRLFGPLPRDSVVALKTKEAAPKRIRIPITGTGQIR